MHIDAEGRMVVCQRLGEGEWEDVGQEHEVSVIPDEWALGI